MTATATIINLLEKLLREKPILVGLSTILITSISTLFILLVTLYILYQSKILSPSLLYQHDQRRRLPKLVIVVRHGESEANADKELWKIIPDNLLGLTPNGQDQARQAGHRIEQVLAQHNASRVHMVISPFERTLQTAQYIRLGFESRIVRTEIDSRIREQEVGNLQGDEFHQYRKQQKQVGRFWYRFPTGESGADVLDRVKSWWHESVLTTNQRVGYELVDAIVVVTHGLTMRHILTQLFGWSPTTFHSVWNANNCDMYVLRKDLQYQGLSPYVLDEQLGDVPRSSIDVSITLKTTNVTHVLKLENYLAIPPPRSRKLKLIRRMLSQQYPDIVPNPREISKVIIMPFIEGARVLRGRSTSGALTTGSSKYKQKHQLRQQGSSCITDSSTSDDASIAGAEELKLDETLAFDAKKCQQYQHKEASMRYPCGKLLQELNAIDLADLEED